ETGLRWRRHSGLGGNGLRLARQQGSRSTAWRIVLRPECRYQALRLRRTAARLRGLTAALRPSVWDPCRSTAQWIALEWARPRTGSAGDRWRRAQPVRP